MHILHIDSGTEMRGGQWQVVRLIEGLRARNHRNVLVARQDAPLFAEARRREIEVHPLNFQPLLRCTRVSDITHAHDARSHTTAALLAPLRLVVSRRVAFPVRQNPLSRWKYGRATHYIAVSGFVRQILLDAGVAPSRITVVYDGVPMQPPAVGTEILLPESHDPRKGMALALAGVRLAGLAARLSNNLEQDLALAALFLYITHSEGLGSAVLLAMAAGVPVIASKVGGLVEIVDHERTGLLTENSPEAIASAIRRLTEDRPFAQSLATQARSVVGQRFSIDRMVTDTLAVYEAIA
jgi:glycosyltransferase involved in cell wall biosynthesis